MRLRGSEKAKKLHVAEVRKILHNNESVNMWL